MTLLFILAYDLRAGLYGAMLIAADAQQGVGVWAERPEGLAQQIASSWPGLPIYCGRHADLAAELRRWLPDVREGLPERDGSS